MSLAEITDKTANRPDDRVFRRYGPEEPTGTQAYSSEGQERPEEARDPKVVDYSMWQAKFALNN